MFTNMLITELVLLRDKIQLDVKTDSGNDKHTIWTVVPNGKELAIRRSGSCTFVIMQDATLSHLCVLDYQRVQL